MLRSSHYPGPRHVGLSWMSRRPLLGSVCAAVAGRQDFNNQNPRRRGPWASSPSNMGSAARNLRWTVSIPLRAVLDRYAANPTAGFLFAEAIRLDLAPVGSPRHAVTIGRHLGDKPRPVACHRHRGVACHGHPKKTKERLCIPTIGCLLSIVWRTLKRGVRRHRTSRQQKTISLLEVRRRT